MVYLPENSDTLGILHTFAFGLADPPEMGIRSGPVFNVAEAFTLNLVRLKSLMAFPAYLADFSSHIHRFQLIAHHEEFDDFDIENRLNDGPTAKKLFKRFQELFHERTQSLIDMQNDASKLEKLANDMAEKGGAIAVIISMSAAAANSFELAMMSYITSAWTMFETAAADLWEAALNYRPQGLAELSGAKRYRRRDANRAKDEAQKLEKSVKLDSIRAHEWDTRNRMGSILRDKFAFTTLGRIREAYESAFYKKADDIDKVITNECFDRLSALRNVIVHKAAKADAEYVRRCRDFPALPQVQKGDKITFHGQMVANLIYDCSNATCALIIVVDAWLADNAINPPDGDTHTAVD